MSTTVRLCDVCGRPKYQKHFETCPGQRPAPRYKGDDGVREAERRYETWLESLKDHGP